MTRWGLSQELKVDSISENQSILVNKNYMIISIATLNNPGIDMNFFNLIRRIYKKRNPELTLYLIIKD